ncbi:MAG: hypothetical protein WCS52_01025 [bacterium]
MFFVIKVFVQDMLIEGLFQKEIRVKKRHLAPLLVVLVLAGTILGPAVAEARDAKPESPAAKPDDKYLNEIEAIYQKGLAAREAAQKTADTAREALAKAEAALKDARSDGDKKRIKAAEAEWLNAKNVVLKTSETLNQMDKLVDRLNVINDKAKILAKEDEHGKLENLAEKASVVLDFISEISKHHPPIIIVVPPPCTTSTTQPSPTPVGHRG